MSYHNVVDVDVDRALGGGVDGLVVVVVYKSVVLS